MKSLKREFFALFSSPRVNQAVIVEMGKLTAAKFALDP